MLPPEGAVSPSDEEEEEKFTLENLLYIVKCTLYMLYVYINIFLIVHDSKIYYRKIHNEKLNTFQVYGEKNPFWAALDFCLQYLLWPLEKNGHATILSV